MPEPKADSQICIKESLLDTVCCEVIRQRKADELDPICWEKVIEILLDLFGKEIIGQVWRRCRIKEMK